MSKPAKSNMAIRRDDNGQVTGFFIVLSKSDIDKLLDHNAIMFQGTEGDFGVAVAYQKTKAEGRALVAEFLEQTKKV